MTLAQQAAEALAGLGDTPDEIAAMLLGAGYRGVRGMAFDCPCGQCLEDHFGSPVSVGPDYVNGEYRNAPQVTEFIHAFDAGKYPELVQP